MTVDNLAAERGQDISLVPETASDSAVRFIRAMIFSGELGPGDKLPPERDLGARLGISRMTLRLALKALESTGYIVTTRGSHGGSRVANSDSLVECWELWMRHHAGELDDLFEFRVTVETRLAALAAERRTQADIENMERALDNERRPQDWSAVFRADIDIHRSIARAARSPRLEKAMLEARGDLFVPVDLRSLEEPDASVHDTHERILAAIREQDAQAAITMMRLHIEMIQGLTDKALEAAGIGPTRL
jgi:GntR family transcriptional repressor for pyruvate dehydrogenase complex